MNQQHKTSNGRQYIYIVQASLEPAKCKIGITNNLERRLSEYNNMTGKSKDNIYIYLFTCQVKNMRKVEDAIKGKFLNLREEKSKEIYFYNQSLFQDYVGFVKSHESFTRETFIKPEDKKIEVRIVKKITPNLKERGISRKDVLQKAKRVNNDEFYTRYEDVEKELNMYSPSTWGGKVVFCNCDDAVGDDRRNTSAFALYFLKKFNELGLKKLICTHYGGQTDLFNAGAKGYIFTKNGFREWTESPAGYTGSFDDPLSIKVLKEEADIVCTNPPFSRAADYWKLTIGSGKKFIIISNITNMKNHAYIPYFIHSEVWAGYNRVDSYLNSRKEIAEAAGHWFTNVPIKSRPKYRLLKIVPLKSIPDKYKKYDDNKILVVQNGFIPSDYAKPFAVSVRPLLNGLLEKGYRYFQDKEYVPYVNQKRQFGMALVQKDQQTMDH